MIKYGIIRIVVVFTLLLNATDSLLAQSDSSSVLKRIEKIEAREVLQEEKQKLMLEELENKAEIQLIKKQHDFIIWILAFLGLGTLAGAISLFFYIPNEVKKKADQEVKNRIESIVSNNETSVLNLIEEHNEEKNLFQNKIIRIWGEKDYTTLTKVLQNVEFKSSNIFWYDEVKQGQAYDVLIINNENAKKLSKVNNFLFDAETEDEREKRVKKEEDKFTDQWAEIEQLIKEQAPNVCVLYYCNRNVRMPLEKIRDVDLQARINFATNPAQIYGNLLNTLKYQEKIANS